MAKVLFVYTALSLVLLLLSKGIYIWGQGWTWTLFFPLDLTRIAFWLCFGTLLSLLFLISKLQKKADLSFFSLLLILVCNFFSHYLSYLFLVWD